MEDVLQLSFVTQELLDEVGELTGLEGEQVVQYALSYALLTTNLPYDIQTAQSMALKMAQPDKPALRVLKKVE